MICKGSLIGRGFGKMKETCSEDSFFFGAELLIDKMIGRILFWGRYSWPPMIYLYAAEEE